MERKATRATLILTAAAAALRSLSFIGGVTTPRKRKAYPSMVISSAEDIQAWNNNVRERNRRLGKFRV